MIDFENTRLILFHKHPVSACMHFLYFRNGSVCAFKELPKLAAIIDKNNGDESGVQMHPSVVASWGEQELHLDCGTLNTEAEFCEHVEVPGKEITVYLAGFNGYELPIESLSQFGAKFVTLMECVGIAPVEMLLLQKAYRVIMGG